LRVPLGSVSIFLFSLPKIDTMGMLKEFREFAMKGNIVELAVAVILGGAFGSIVSSLVDDVITPLLLAPALEAVHATDLDKLVWNSVKYGKFLAATIKFVVVAFVMFGLVKGMNRMIKKEAEKPAATPEEVLLLREIRDSLQKKG
jgi:large conductance mechanosensitive channel